MGEDNLSHQDLTFNADRSLAGTQNHCIPEFTPNDGDYYNNLMEV